MTLTLFTKVDGSLEAVTEILLKELSSESPLDILAEDGSIEKIELASRSAATAKNRTGNALIDKRPPTIKDCVEQWYSKETTFCAGRDNCQVFWKNFCAM